MPAPIGAGGEGGIAATMIPALLVSISSTQTKFVLLSVLPLAAGEFGLDNAWTGSVLAMSVGALGTGQLVIGKVVDHLGVRHAATACLLAMAAATAAMAQAQGPEVLLVGSIVRSFFSTSTLPIMTKLIAASVPATEQGRAFGWVSLAGRFGAVVGSTTPAALVALGLVAPGQFRSNLVFSAAFVTLGAVTAFVTYPPKTQETAVLVAHQEQAVGKTATVFSNPTFWLMITANCVLTLVIDVDGFLPMIANDYSPPERLASDSALILSAFPAGTALSVILGSHVAARGVGANRLMFTMLLGTAVAFGGAAALLALAEAPHNSFADSTLAPLLAVAVFLIGLCVGYPYFVPPLVWITQNAAEEAGIASSYLDAAGFFAAVAFNKWAGGASVSLGWPWVMALLGVAAFTSAAMFTPVDFEPKHESKVAGSSKRSPKPKSNPRSKSKSKSKSRSPSPAARRTRRSVRKNQA